MSKTDKTRPIWVQVKDPDNKGWLREEHDHRKGFCDLGDVQDPLSHGWGTWRWIGMQRKCTYEYTSLAYYGGIHRRRPKMHGWGRPARDGRARMHLRMIRDELRKTAPCDIDLVDRLWMYPNEKLLWHKWRD